MLKSLKGLLGYLYSVCSGHLGRAFPLEVLHSRLSLEYVILFEYTIPLKGLPECVISDTLIITAPEQTR